MRKCKKNHSDSNRDSVTRTTFDASGTFHFEAVRDSLEARHSNTRQNLQLRSKILKMPNSNFKAFPPPIRGKISSWILKWGLEIVGNEVVMSKCPKTVFFVKITDHRSILPFRPLGGVFRTNPGAPRNDWLASIIPRARHEEAAPDRAPKNGSFGCRPFAKVQISKAHQRLKKQNWANPQASSTTVRLCESC